ncbi:hypothetical protein TNCV_1283211 [Trichonephila clavipes]|uniref:Uncharacterized protein n=1 Tax=Trichonephila clavipes TaxID=2585209 RepID=A0A8X6SL26_TRICX|nr:hypothetical protein TNCV_1283211 [Trichonephila clavipes]
MFSRKTTVKFSFLLERHLLDIVLQDALCPRGQKNGNQNLLFIARATINTSSVLCQFDADTLVHHISINGVKQDLFSENISSVFKVTGLKNGSNKVTIATAHYPESEVYRLF